MTPLRPALEAFLRAWRQDCPAEWLALLGDAEPDYAAVPAQLRLETHERIIPLRKGHHDPIAPAGSHVLRALQGLRPDGVRAVILGQDPYPKLSRATGRSFEPGDLADWQGAVPESLRRILLVLAQQRGILGGGALHDERWPALRTELLHHRLEAASPRDLFDHWERQGVLCLNSALTLSRFDPPHTPTQERVQLAHLALWRPVVGALLRGLACRPQGALLVLLWGRPAREAFADMGVEAAAAAAGQSARLQVLAHAHPGAEGKPDPGAAPFYAAPNPFSAANARLLAAGQAPIAW